MKKDNTGVTLVEIIVAVAIIAILVTTAGLGIGAVSGKPAEKCAQMLAAELQVCRTAAMGKYEAQMCIYREDATQQIKVIQTVVEKKEEEEKVLHEVVLGDAQVQVTVIRQDGSRQALDSTGTVVSFERATGALDREQSECLGFEITKGNTTKTVTIIALTGRIEIE